MEADLQELLRDFFCEANVQAVGNDIDLPLQRLVDDVRCDSAVYKRDLRRLMEKDPTGFLHSACRILKLSTQTAGVAPLLDLLWSSPLLLTCLIDPSMLPLSTATALAKRWVAFDPMLDIKLLQIGFPLGEDDAIWVVDMMRARRALGIVADLPPNRHILLALVKLLRNPDAYVRSKAALVYARASKNPEWVRKMLAEPEARVRASAVEGLWDTKSSFAAALFMEAALDPDHRVAANALIGLHYCGETNAAVTEGLQSMVHSREPAARAAAAFVMGQIMDANGPSILENLLRDRDQGVRGAALRALIRIRRHDRQEATREAATVADSLAEAQGPSASENAPECQAVHSQMVRPR